MITKTAFQKEMFWENSFCNNFKSWSHKMVRSGNVFVFRSCRQGCGLQNISVARINFAIITKGITKTIVTPNCFVIFLAGMATRARLRDKPKGDKPRFSQRQTQIFADFCWFSPFPRKQSIWKAQIFAENCPIVTGNRRELQELAENSRLAFVP